MKGSNTMELNQATVIEAMQEWIDRRWSGTRSDCPVVHRVREKTSSPLPVFEVSLKEPPQEDAGPE